MKRRPFGLTGAMLALAALEGCTVGPDYHLPGQAAINDPAATAPLTEGSLTSTDALPARWWSLYEDPVLDALEEQALAANTDLRVAGANLARSAAMVRSVKGISDPQMALDASVERARLSGESFLKYETLPVTNLGIGKGAISYQLDLFGQIRRRVERAGAEHEATEALVEAVQVTVAAEVARAYVAVCGENEAQNLAEERLNIEERLADTARRLHTAGKTGASEVTRAEGLVLAARARLPLHRAGARAALYRLAFLLGRAPSDYPREAEACHALPELERPLPIGDGSALLSRRPDVRAAERTLAASTAGIGIARADLYPHVTLGFGGGTFGLLEDVGSAMAGHWSLGSMISWIFPTRAQLARIDAARAETDRSLAAFDGTVLQALRETETALVFYRENHNRAADLSEMRAHAETLAAQDRQLFHAGKTGLAGELASQLQLVQARDDERAARDEVAQSQVDLFLALGGGW